MSQPETLDAGAAPPAGTSDEPLLRDYEPRDADAVIALCRAAFPRWPLPPGDLDPHAYLDWFAEAPASVRTHMDVAVLDGRIVSVVTGVRHPARVLDEVVICSVGGTGHATEPGLQARGLRNALRHRSLEHDPQRLVPALTDRPASLVGDQRVPLADELSFYLKVLRLRSAAGSRPGRRWLNTLAYAWLQLRGRLSTRRAERSAPWAIRAVEAFDERVDAFVAEASRPWDFIVLPTQDYLNWRYLDARAGEFHAFIAEQDGAMLGYLICSNRWGRGDITDVLALPGRTDVVRSLLDAAIARLAADGASAVECRMMRRDPYADTLRRTGFVRIEKRSKALARQFSLTVRGLDRERFAALGEPGAALHVVHGQFDEA
jgi:hypothetical protein